MEFSIKKSSHLVWVMSSRSVFPASVYEAECLVFYCIHRYLCFFAHLVLVCVSTADGAADWGLCSRPLQDTLWQFPAWQANESRQGHSKPPPHPIFYIRLHQQLCFHWSSRAWQENTKAPRRLPFLYVFLPSYFLHLIFGNRFFQVGAFQNKPFPTCLAPVSIITVFLVMHNCFIFGTLIIPGTNGGGKHSSLKLKLSWHKYL